MHSISGRCRTTFSSSRFFLGGLLVFGLGLHAGNRAAHSQSPPAPASTTAPTTKPVTWNDVVGLLESEEPADIEQVEKVLRESLRTRERTEEMACALALTCLKRQDTQAAIKALSGIRVVFPNPNPDTQCFVARAQLWILLSQSDAELAKKSAPIFRDLFLKTCRDKGLSAATLRANAMALGGICGMLRSEQSGKWIPAEDLDIAEKYLLESPLVEISSTFKYRLASATERAAGIEKTIERIRKLDPDAAAVEQTKREERLAELRTEFESVKEGSLEVLRNAREAIKENTSERRRLSELLRSLELQWKLVTPGHPGAPPREPKEPRRSDVRVDEYEWREEYENVRDAKGNVSRQPTRRRVRRDDQDIRREEEAEYHRLRNRYRVEKDQYDRAAAQYSQLLTAWTQRDTARRANLKAQQTTALARRTELEVLSEALKEEQAAAATELTDLKSELEKLEDEYELSQVALEAIEKNTTTIAFQPAFFKVLDLQGECIALLNRARAAK